MKKIGLVLYRYRLLTNVLALVLVLGALALPARGDVEPLAMECENGCVGWNAQQGCTNCQRCCVDGGNYRCWRIGNDYCS